MATIDGRNHLFPVVAAIVQAKKKTVRLPRSARDIETSLKNSKYGRKLSSERHSPSGPQLTPGFVFAIRQPVLITSPD